MPTVEQLAELDAIIAELKERPERHNQRSYVSFVGNAPPQVTPALDCGSAFCIAGAAVARAGVGIQWVESRNSNALQKGWVASCTTEWDSSGGAFLTIHSKAAELLGLSWGEADELFSQFNSMKDIEAIRAGLEVTP